MIDILCSAYTLITSLIGTIVLAGALFHAITRSHHTEGGDDR